MVFVDVIGNDNCQKTYDSKLIYENDMVFGDDPYCDFNNGISTSKYFFKGQVIVVGKLSVECKGSYVVYIKWTFWWNDLFKSIFSSK